MRSIPGLLLMSVFALSLPGCTPRAAGTSSTPVPRRAGLLTASDLHPFQDVHRAIVVLRRHWLTARTSGAGARPLVLVDGIMTSGLEVLSGIPGHQVLEIRYMPAHEASIRYAGGQLDGAILVTMKR